MQSALQNLPWLKKAKKSNPEQHLLNANQQIQTLLTDTGIPASVRQELSQEFAEIEAISEKLQHSEIHIAAFGRVGTGKSSLLNALLGRKVFSTSPLHGETRIQQRSQWDSANSDHVVLIDTPGIDELEGEAREELANSVARIADIVLMVCEGDLTETELTAVRSLAARQRPLLLVLNKSDRYSKSELRSLLAHLKKRCELYIEPDNILSVSADPRPEPVIRVDEAGNEERSHRPRTPDIGGLKTRLWSILEKEGKTLAALNAALFTSELDGRIASKIVLARKTVAEKIIRNYCLAKGLVVAVNPVPAADLLAAAGTDVAMVIHLGNVYGFAAIQNRGQQIIADHFRTNAFVDGHLLGCKHGFRRHENHQCRHVCRNNGRCPGHPGLVCHLCHRHCCRIMVCQREVVGYGGTKGYDQRNTGLAGPGFNFAIRPQ